MNKPDIILLTGVPPVSARRLEESGIPLSSFVKKQSGVKKDFYFPIHTMGAITVASHLFRHGYNARVVDYYIDKFDVTGAKIIGISSSFMELSHQLAHRIRISPDENWVFHLHGTP